MTKNLYIIATKYVAILEKIENTSDAQNLQSLEEQRVELHWEFMELLKQ